MTIFALISIKIPVSITLSLNIQIKRWTSLYMIFSMVRVKKSDIITQAQVGLKSFILIIKLTNNKSCHRK
jgi:hypothetical protein